MRTSGLNLDLYDDSRGEVLKEIYPTREDLPDIVKQAHALSPGERQALPDDVFALVLVNGDEKLRKYACTDPGNTTLSVAYFLKNGHKLPTEAQKTAAENLRTACSWYDIEPPTELDKVALVGFLAKRVVENPIGALQTALTAPAVAKGVGNEVKARNEVARTAKGTVVTPEQVQHALGRKHAEISGSVHMPLQPPADPTPKTKTTVKTSGMLQPYVDVSGLTAPVTPVEKKANLTALGTKYPLDNYKQVEAAARYFDEYGQRFAPADRHTYCVALTKRANALGIPVSDLVKKYGSESFASDAEVKIAFDARRAALQDTQHREVLNQIERTTREQLWKEASGPAEACAALEEFDKQAGLDFFYDGAGIPDPYFSIYGEVKTAEDNSDYSWVDGNDMVVARDLETLAKTNVKTIERAFSKDLAKEFRKDPVGIFKSLPLAQKKIISRMAAEPIVRVEMGM